MGECPPLPSPDLSKQLNRSTSDTPRSGSHLIIFPFIVAHFLMFDFFTEAPRPRPKRLRTDSLLSVSVKLIPTKHRTWIFESSRWGLRVATPHHHHLLHPLLPTNSQGGAPRFQKIIFTFLLSNFPEYSVTFLLQQLRSQPGTPVDGGSPRREEGVQVSKSGLQTPFKMCHGKGHRHGFKMSATLIYR